MEWKRRGGMKKERNFTSMRKAGEWRTLQIGSPNRSVKRESSPLGPTSHLLSTSSTLLQSFSGWNSLTTTTTLPPPPPPPPPSSPILFQNPQTKFETSLFPDCWRVEATLRERGFIEGEGSAEGWIAAFSRLQTSLNNVCYKQGKDTSKSSKLEKRREETQLICIYEKR